MLNISHNLVQTPKTVIIGGGQVGLYIAKRLQKKIKKLGGHLILIDPFPYMTYQPFLPEVASGNIDFNNILISIRDYLKCTDFINGQVVKISHKKHQITVQTNANEKEYRIINYENIILSAGSITKSMPIEGLSNTSIGLKNIEEAIYIKNHVLSCINQASMTLNEDIKKGLLTFVIVGGGFAGIELITELEDMARYVIKKHYPKLKVNELNFNLIEAMNRVMPEVSESQFKWIMNHMKLRNIHIHLNTFLKKIQSNNIYLFDNISKKNKKEFFAKTIIWTAGIKANTENIITDFPKDDQGRILVDEYLRITDNKNVYQSAWSAGDIARVPDILKSKQGKYSSIFCPPSAQHAVRQADCLLKNFLISQRANINIYNKNRKFIKYKHKNLGVVASLGLYKGIANIRGIKLYGITAWIIHRIYHLYALPSIKKKIKLFINFLISFIFKRDLMEIKNLSSPNLQFLSSFKK